MKRFAFALGLLATIAASQSDAGYVVVRIILQGSSGAGAGDAGPGGPGAMPGSGPGGPGGAFRPSGPPQGPGSGPGGMPGMPGMPGMGGTEDETDPSHDPTRSVFAVVSYTNDLDKKQPFYYKQYQNSRTNPLWKGLTLKHPFGHTNVLFDNAQIQLYTDLGPTAPTGMRTRETEVKLRYLRWQKNPTEGQLLLDIVSSSLESGLVDLAVKYADELLKLAQDPGKKLQQTPQVSRFVTAYEKVQKLMRERATAAGIGPSLQSRLTATYSAARSQSSAHYYLIYWDATAEERTRRLAQLEENFQAFFLLYAIRGVALPVPPQPLTVILAKSANDVSRLSLSLDGLPRSADAFYSPDLDVVVLSPERMDPIGRTFRRQAQQYYRGGFNRHELLEGKGPEIDGRLSTAPGNDPNNPMGSPELMPPSPGGVPMPPKKKDHEKKHPDEVARMMTWAMVDRVVGNASEWSGISREASRQLLYATGVFPSHVVLPQWLSEGAADFFHRPQKPVFTLRDDKAVVTLAVATGYGAPNYVRQKQFAELLQHNELNADPGQLVRNIVSDAYFAAIHQGIDADDPKWPHPPKKHTPPAGTLPGMPPGGPGGPGFPGPMGPGGAMGPGGPLGLMQPGMQLAEDANALRRFKAEFLLNKAHATAWALYYYLAKYEPANLDRYLAEMNKLPRDLPLNESTRLAVFTRALDLNTPEAIAAFGKKWLNMMKTTPQVGIDVVLHPPQLPKDTDNPMNPGSP